MLNGQRMEIITLSTFVPAITDSPAEVDTCEHADKKENS
uniref:Uncharacterized protein n=1 Tax=Meloidogyne floridensis TaxID=298350 RepID=A0A915NXZ0_9BILA